MPKLSHRKYCNAFAVYFCTYVLRPFPPFNSFIDCFLRFSPRNQSGFSGVRVKFESTIKPFSRIANKKTVISRENSIRVAGISGIVQLVAIRA